MALPLLVPEEEGRREQKGEEGRRRKKSEFDTTYDTQEETVFLPST